MTMAPGAAPGRRRTTSGGASGLERTVRTCSSSTGTTSGCQREFTHPAASRWTTGADAVLATSPRRCPRWSQPANHSRPIVVERQPGDIDRDLERLRRARGRRAARVPGPRPRAVRGRLPSPRRTRHARRRGRPPARRAASRSGAGSAGGCVGVGRQVGQIGPVPAVLARVVAADGDDPVTRHHGELPDGHPRRS